MYIKYYLEFLLKKFGSVEKQKLSSEIDQIRNEIHQLKKEHLDGKLF